MRTFTPSELLEKLCRIFDGRFGGGRVPGQVVPKVSGVDRLLAEGAPLLRERPHGSLVAAVIAPDRGAVIPLHVLVVAGAVFEHEKNARGLDAEHPARL